MMNSKELLTTVLHLEKGDRIPFCPAIYEHKGFLIGKTPSEICRNSDYLVQGLLKEYEVYKPDFLAVGIDVYNVEAEALGCEIVYFDDSPDVPGVSKHVIDTPEDLSKLKVPNPLTDGRMPLYLKAAKEIQNQIGDKVMIRGAITGPFSLASELVGAENFIVLTLTNINFVKKLLRFTSKVAAAFGKAYIDLGLDPIIFDSRAMPPLCSPSIFNEIVSPIYKNHLIPELKQAGAKHIPLIIGGNTTSIIDALVDTGCTQLLCDFEGDMGVFKQKCEANSRPVRMNVDPRLLHLGPIKKIQEFTMNILHECWDHPGFILGTGVAAYDCPPEHIHAVRECLDMDYKNYQPKTSTKSSLSTDPNAISQNAAGYDDDLAPVLREMGEAIEDGDEEEVPELVTEALSSGIKAEDVIGKGMIPAMDLVGGRFSKNEIYVPEMLISARAMKSGMTILRPALIISGVQPIGTVLLGTVKGDIHDIGKNLVGMMLEGAGFAIKDLGVNVPAEVFVETLLKTGIRIVGLSALLTTTMNYMAKVIEELEKAGIRDEVKVLVGGAPINQKFCDKIGADYYGESAADAVLQAKMSLAEIN